MWQGSPLCKSSRSFIAWRSHLLQEYFEIIKNPMDFGTVRQKLLEYKYQDHIEYCDDVRLVFQNAWTFNQKKHRVYKMTQNVAAGFYERVFHYVCISFLHAVDIVVFSGSSSIMSFFRVRVGPEKCPIGHCQLIQCEA